MICSKCAHREYLRYKNIEAFDCGELRKVSYDNIDYCHKHRLPCDDAYLDCEYREISIEVEKLESIRDLMTDSYDEYETLDLKTALNYINEILEEE
jgi:hypothetical protein